MKTITKIKTNKTPEEVFTIINTLLVNNGFGKVDGQAKWMKGDGSLSVILGITASIEDETIVFESWIHDKMIGERGIEKGFLALVPKKKVRKYLRLLINELQSPDTEVEGYNPPTDISKINTNSETLERVEKTYSFSAKNVISAVIALVVIIIGLVVTFASNYVYFYFPFVSAAIGLSAIFAEKKHAADSGQKASGAVYAMSIIAIVLSAINLLMIF